jgi:hypothetical protein
MTLQVSQINITQEEDKNYVQNNITIQTYAELPKPINLLLTTMLDYFLNQIRYFLIL